MNNSLHHSTSRGLGAVFSLLLGLFAWTASDLGAYPSYPKLYGDGRGLAITAFSVQRLNGSTWEKADWYMAGQSYRIRARFTNFYHDGIPILGPAFGNTGIHITNVIVKMQFPGARFVETQRADSTAFLMPYWVDDHPDFNDTIAPEESRWFNFGHFTRVSGPVQVNSRAISLYTVSREILYMPPGNWGNLVPN
jgi:hypothetical protein